MQYITETKEFQITEPTVVSIGKFDGLHVGHQKLVREMVRWKEKGLKVAMFTFSTPPLSLVGGRKQTVLMTNRERMELRARPGWIIWWNIPLTRRYATWPRSSL